MIIVAVVETGNYMGRGAEYVAKLYAMVKRNTTLPFVFCVITDDPSRHGLSTLHAGYQPLMPGSRWAIETDHDGWWAKMDLFRGDMFLEGARVVYFDLDTIITGNIDRLLVGQTHSLRDGSPSFLGNWRTGGWPLSTAAMAFTAGDLDEVYEEWRRQGWPITRWGDDEFVRNAVNKLHIDWHSLQHQFPVFTSYKFHKLGDKGLGPMDKIVCFVQRPKPHDLTEDWARKAWSLQDEPSSPMIEGEQVSETVVPSSVGGSGKGEGAATPSPPTSKE